MKANALRIVLSVSFIFVGLVQTQSQENSVSQDLIRDWSDQKESTFLVSKRSIQNETGFFYENSENQNLSKTPRISYNLDAESGEDSPEASCLYTHISSNSRLEILDNL